MKKETDLYLSESLHRIVKKGCVIIEWILEYFMYHLLHHKKHIVSVLHKQHVNIHPKSTSKYEYEADSE